MAVDPPTRYQAEPADARIVVPLDAMTLIYQRRSGITHIVAAPVPELLSAMSDDNLSAAELAQRLSGQFQLSAEDDITAIVAARLEELAALGLVLRA